MRVIGLSGGIACGKSTVSKHLVERGFTVIDCDEIAHSVTRKNRWGYRRVVKSFGRHILLPNGDIDRAALGRVVFQDAAARRRLNRATHLPVALELLRQVLLAWLSCRAVVVIDMPLLFESGAHKFMSRILLVATSPALQRQRLAARDGLSAADAEARISAQMPVRAKMALAPAGLVVVQNDGTPAELRALVDALCPLLLRGAVPWALLTSPAAAAALGAGLVLLLRQHWG